MEQGRGLLLERLTRLNTLCHSGVRKRRVLLCLTVLVRLPTNRCTSSSHPSGDTPAVCSCCTGRSIWTQRRWCQSHDAGT